MFCDGERSGNWFRRIAHKGVGGVHIKVEIVGQIRCDTAASDPSDVVERVLKAGKVMQVFER